MRRQCAAVALLSVAATCQVFAQLAPGPVRDAGVSVVMRCQDCGTIETIREVQETRSSLPTGVTSPSPNSVSSPSPVGLIMYVPLGKKVGTDTPYLGSVGSRQWQERTANTRYEFVVRMDDGNYRTLPRQGVSDFSVGDRVKLSQLEIEHWTQK